MAHADVSFTFLDRVREIEQNIADRRWPSPCRISAAESRFRKS